MLEKLDHIGIAVKNLDQAMELYEKRFRILPSLVYESPHTKAKIAFFPVGELRIELLQPTTPDSVMGKFLEKKGEGIHHIAYKVKDIATALRQLEEEGVRLVDKTPRRVRDSESVAFLHPGSTNGVLIELVQEDE